MRGRILFMLTAAACLATGAGAQTKIAGTSTCGKPDVEHSLDVGDRPGHAFRMTQGKCKWTKPLEIGGSAATEDFFTNFSEVRPTGSRDHGYVVASFASGDKAFVRFHGATAVKDGQPQGAQGAWSYTGGAGKLRGLKGKGTFKSTPNADGTWTLEVEGEYTLPPPRPPKMGAS